MVEYGGVWCSINAELANTSAKKNNKAAESKERGHRWWLLGEDAPHQRPSSIIMLDRCAVVIHGGFVMMDRCAAVVIHGGFHHWPVVSTL